MPSHRAQVQTLASGRAPFTIHELRVTSHELRVALLVPQIRRAGAIRLREAEVEVGRDGARAAARRALEVALLYEIGLEHVLYGVALLADRSGEIVDADR